MDHVAVSHSFLWAYEACDSMLLYGLLVNSMRAADIIRPLPELQ
ncbi:hypothetical protein HMPREF9137_0064 [Prevotella denticola F0289]|nr:hypothetical protein HMPREF9137_0064 [Prevotella denticola F0289]